MKEMKGMGISRAGALHLEPAKAKREGQPCEEEGK
jgi:hypothetical protein